jgi:hypothetical protein
MTEEEIALFGASRMAAIARIWVVAEAEVMAEVIAVINAAARGATGTNNPMDCGGKTRQPWDAMTGDQV